MPELRLRSDLGRKFTNWKRIGGSFGSGSDGLGRGLPSLRERGNHFPLALILVRYRPASAVCCNFRNHATDL